MRLLKTDGAYDRAAIMRKAHREARAARRRGETGGFSEWLSYAWRVARDQRARRGAAIEPPLRKAA